MQMIDSLDELALSQLMRISMVSQFNFGLKSKEDLPYFVKMQPMQVIILCCLT